MGQEEYVDTTEAARGPSARPRKHGEATREADEAETCGGDISPAPEPAARLESQGSNYNSTYPPGSMASVIHELVVALRAVATEPAGGLPSAIEGARERLLQIQLAEAARSDSASITLVDACSLLLDVLDELARSIATSAMEAVRRERRRMMELLAALEDDPQVSERHSQVESARQSGPLVARGTSSGPLAHPLTPQEQIVLGLLAEGAGTKEIAEALTISPTTAKKHVCNVLEKLDAPNRLSAVLRAQALGLLPGSDQADRH